MTLGTRYTTGSWRVFLETIACRAPSSLRFFDQAVRAA